MEEKSRISPSGVITVKRDEGLGSRTEFQQNPSFLQFVGPTTVVSPHPPPQPPQPPATVTPGSAAVTPPSISSADGSDPTKKKRGRPRKYAPDGSLNPRASRPTLSPTPISSSIPLSGDYHHSNWKRGKSQQTQQQPLEFVKKSHKFEFESSPAHSPPPPPPGLSHYVGANFTTHQFTVNAGEDVTMKIMPYSQQGARAICILSATGSISNVTLRQPTTSGGTLTYEGRFEILSLSGSFMPTENGGTKGRSGGMSVSLAGPNGRIIGGGLAGMLIAAGPVQVVMGSFIVMHQTEQIQKKKPRIMEASAQPPQPQSQPPQPQSQPPQQQPPTFTITTVNSTSPVVATVEAPKQPPYGGGVVRPMAQMPSSFHNDNSAVNHFTTTYHRYGNMNTVPNKHEDDEEDDDGGDDYDSGDTRSQSNSG